MANQPELPFGPLEQPVRTHVLTDDPLVRSALDAALLQAEVVRSVERLGDADVVLWIPGADTAELQARLGELARIEPPAIALLDDVGDVDAVLSAGARGAVRRSIQPAPLATAVVAVHFGLVVAEGDFRAEEVERAALEDSVELTAREHQVLQELARGRSNRQLAEALGISAHTAKFHVNAILGKLGASTRTEAVVRAARMGLLTL